MESVLGAPIGFLPFQKNNQLYVDDNALSVNITRIRDKLAAIGLVDFIKTKHRQGDVYKRQV